MSVSLVAKILAGVFSVTTFALLLRLLRPVNRRRIVDVLVVGSIGWLIVSKSMNRQPEPEAPAFARAVDLTPIKEIAVQNVGRIKSFDSVARTQVRAITGGKRMAGQEPAFTFLDMMFRPQAYAEAECVYIKKKPVRDQIRMELEEVTDTDPVALKRMMKTGLFPPALLNLPAIQSLLDRLELDAMRTARPVNALRGALARLRPEVLESFLKVIPPVRGDLKAPWHTVSELAQTGVADLDNQTRTRVTNRWQALADAWQRMDAAAVNENARRFAELARSINPVVYPDIDRLRLENWYFRWYGMTWIWIFYLAAIVPLLMASIYHWRWARWIGVVMWVGAFALHTLSLRLRWYISGRIPNSNMFEAITAATWLAGVIAIVLELVARKTPMRNMFFLGGAVAGMAAMMCSHYMPVTLSPDIENIMPILHDVWLYIHTNVIILSYGLIAMAAVTALLYLRYRLGGGGKEFASIGGAGSLIMSRAGRGFLRSGKVTSGQVLDGATMVLMELSFVMLWTGLVMGAIWADHSWGRPWGWDPKEVFALNTFIVFLVLVHVRFKVRDKGLWTAVLAVVGCGVMLFNWIVINFFISGLHSYA